MKKKNKIITVSEKKASISGIVLSAIYAIVCSYPIATVMMEIGLQDRGASIFNLIMLIFPILFIVFGTFALGLIVVFNVKSKK